MLFDWCARNFRSPHEAASPSEPAMNTDCLPLRDSCLLKRSVEAKDLPTTHRKTVLHVLPSKQRPNTALNARADTS